MANRDLAVTTADAILIGGGIASATVAAVLSELEPQWRIQVIEKLDSLGEESSDAWNNAGTGHSALCELNYTPERADGSVDSAKAIQINEQFQISRQFWAHLASNGRIAEPETFIHAVPHMSFVHGEKNVEFLRKRFTALHTHPLFERMQFTTDHAHLAEWAPLVAAGRPADEPFAATWSPDGTDVDFGALTRALLDYATAVGTSVHTGLEVTDIRRMGKDWGVMAKAADGSTSIMRAPFVFVGAGGNALPLLQKTGIKEIRGFGGFPISGEWLRCTNPEVIAEHDAKVYGKAAVGAPPMSVPHLDTRYVAGKRSLMFGPYAGWSPKFLKSGKWTDLIGSVKPGNVREMLAVAYPNRNLIAYLLSELAASPAKRMEALQEYMPTARPEDWEKVVAGQRVQVIAPDRKRGGVLQFGTQMIQAADGSIAGMLGASPGASISPTILIQMLLDMFPGRHDAWERQITGMIPSWGKRLSDDPTMARRTLETTAEALQLTTH